MKRSLPRTLLETLRSVLLHDPLGVHPISRSLSRESVFGSLGLQACQFRRSWALVLVHKEGRIVTKTFFC